MSSNKKPNKMSMPVDPITPVVPVDDMPEPETKDYVPQVVLTPLFHQLFGIAIGQMPYATILTNHNQDKIKLIDLVHFVEAHTTSIAVNELEEIIGFIAYAPFQNVRTMMEIIDNKERHSELWRPLEN